MQLEAVSYPDIFKISQNFGIQRFCRDQYKLALVQ